MKWSFKVLSVSGIDIRVHVTFLLVVLLGAYQTYQLYGTVAGSVFGGLLVLALFVCVTLHELGHSLVAQRFGVGVKEIVLLPIGGVAQLKGEPEKPVHELLIALAGPAVNVLIAALLFGALAPSWTELRAVFMNGPSDAVAPPTLVTFASWLLVMNVAVAVFNMIPAFPMDGGRVLRALLSMMLGKLRATRIAAGIGQLFAVALFIFAYESRNALLAIVSAFVFFAAGQERSFQQATVALTDLSAGEICDPDATTLAPSDQLGVVLDHLLRSPQSVFTVLHGRDLVGVVTREDVLLAAPRLGAGALVAAIMRRQLPVVAAETPLKDLRARLLEARSPAVVRGPEGVLGVLTLEDLSRVASIMQELSRRGLRRPAATPAAES